MVRFTFGRVWSVLGGLVTFCKGLVGLGTTLVGFCKSLIGLVMFCKGLVGLATHLVRVW